MKPATAQEAFRDLQREHIGPELRRLGWRGSAATWVRPHPTRWVMLGLTRSAKHSTRGTVWFTVDLKVLSKDEWDAENLPSGRAPARPSPAARWGVGWEERLAALGPIPDHWTVHPDDDLAALAGEVLSAIVSYGVPEIDRRLAAAEAEPRLCWFNVGGHNWFEPCLRPATEEIALKDRVLSRCVLHAASVSSTRQ